jgi:hypothetical protein
MCMARCLHVLCFVLALVSATLTVRLIMIDLPLERKSSEGALYCDDQVVNGIQVAEYRADSGHIQDGGHAVRAVYV